MCVCDIANNKLEENRPDLQKLDLYIKENSYDKGILLRRRYYGITAEKV